MASSRPPQRRRRRADRSTSAPAARSASAIWPSSSRGSWAAGDRRSRRRPAAAPGGERGRAPAGRQRARPAGARLGPRGQPGRGSALDTIDWMRRPPGAVPPRCLRRLNDAPPAGRSPLLRRAPIPAATSGSTSRIVSTPAGCPRSGPFVDRFERGLADDVGAGHAVATVNGTAALHVALLVAGVEPDDEVLVSTLPSSRRPTPSATWAPGRCSSTPNRTTGRWTPTRARRSCRTTARSGDGELRDRAPAAGPRHRCRSTSSGHPVDMDPLLELARQFGLVVVEDATESLGAKYKGRRVGRPRRHRLLQLQRQQDHHHRRRRDHRTDNATTGPTGAKYLTTQAKDDPLEYVHPRSASTTA